MRFVEWLRDFFGGPVPLRLTSDEERRLNVLLAEQWQREDDYRSRYGGLRSRGHSLAAQLNDGLGLPAGTVVFDETDLRAAHAHSWHPGRRQ